MDILKIKLGNQVYDIKDVVSRTGFATASLVHNVTDSTIDSGNTQFSGIVFYADENKTTPLGTVKLSLVAVPLLSSQYIVTNIIESSRYAVSNSNDGIVDSTWISSKLVNNKPVFLFRSTPTGTASGTATEVLLPVGQSGTVALVSDINTAMADKVGYGSKSVTTPNEGVPYTSLNYYVDLNANTPLFTIDLDEIQTTILTAASGDFYLLNTAGIGFKDLDGTNTNFHPDQTWIKPTSKTENNTTKKFYTFKVGGSSGPTHTVVLPMDADGTIALTSDIETAADNLLDLIDDINTLLGVDGEEYADTIDTYQEIKAFLASMAESPDLADTLATMQTDINGKLTTSDIIDNLTSTATNKALSANQGKVLDGKITTLSNAVVKKISLNGEEISPSSGTVTLPNIVTKILLNGQDLTTDITGTGSVGKVNLDGIVTKINFNGTDVSPVTNSSTGAGVVTITESDPVFSASPASSITAADITNWNNAASGGVTNVSFTTSGSGNSTKYLIQKTVGGTTTSVVELPTATYDSTNEILELILAKTPS